MKTDPLASLAALSPAEAKRIPCRIIRILATVDKKRAETVRWLIDESEHSATRIARACKEAGIDLKEDAIQKHRRRQCPCP